MPKELTLNEFLAKRGYEVPLRFGNVVWRWFFVSFTQPAFGGFWRVWNPFFGYYLAKLYRRIGGDRNRFIACLMTFSVCGFLHDVMILFTDSSHSFGLKSMFSFTVFGLIVAATSPRRIQRTMRKFPWYANVVVNTAFLAAGYVCAHVTWKFLIRTFSG